VRVCAFPLQTTGCIGFTIRWRRRLNDVWNPENERSEAMTGAFEPVRKSTITSSRGCRGLNRCGKPCRASGGAGGYASLTGSAANGTWRRSAARAAARSASTVEVRAQTRAARAPRESRADPLRRDQRRDGADPRPDQSSVLHRRHGPAARPVAGSLGRRSDPPACSRGASAAGSAGPGTLTRCFFSAGAREARGQPKDSGTN
jgi:hypothetical protein